MNIKSKLKSTFYKALEDLNKLPELDTHPLNQRMTYLSYFLKYTGWPTIREHYCNWKAMSLGDGLKSNDPTITSFLIDERLPKVGTWKYEDAFKFCLIHIFAPISNEHYLISLKEPHFDDPAEDLNALKQFS